MRPHCVSGDVRAACPEPVSHIAHRPWARVGSLAAHAPQGPTFPSYGRDGRTHEVVLLLLPQHVLGVATRSQRRQAAAPAASPHRVPRPPLDTRPRRATQIPRRRRSAAASHQRGPGTTTLAKTGGVGPGQIAPNTRAARANAGGRTGAAEAKRELKKSWRGRLLIGPCLLSPPPPPSAMASTSTAARPKLKTACVGFYLCCVLRRG